MKYMKWTDLNIGDKVIIRKEILNDWRCDGNETLAARLSGKILTISNLEEEKDYLILKFSGYTFHINKDTGTSTVNFGFDIINPLFELIELAEDK